MTRPTIYDLFLSYSRHDEALLLPMAQLLKLGDRRVFRDQESIDPGSEFETEIEQAIAKSALVAVFWCCQAADSNWVEREIALATQHGIKIVPVLLCPQALPLALQRIQWIDMTFVVSHECDHTPKQPSRVLREPDRWAYPFWQYWNEWWKSNEQLLGAGSPRSDDPEQRRRVTELIIFRSLMGEHQKTQKS